jgi:predicted nucleic acid-binding protein
VSPRLGVPLVFIDSNVLYPVRLADLVLSSADDGFFAVCVSEDLLSEIERVLINSKGLALEKAKVFTNAVAANATRVATRSEYQQLTAALSGPDSDDLLHLAAAIVSNCDVLLTNNIRDFTKAFVPDGQRVPTILTPEQLFREFISDGLGQDLAQTVLRISEKLRRPPRSPQQILDGLEACGLIETAGSLRSYFEYS